MMNKGSFFAISNISGLEKEDGLEEEKKGRRGESKLSELLAKYLEDPIKQNTVVIAYVFVCGVIYNFVYSLTLDPNLFPIFSLADHLKSSFLVAGTIFVFLVFLCLTLILMILVSLPFQIFIGRVRCLKKKGVSPLKLSIQGLVMVVSPVVAITLLASFWYSLEDREGTEAVVFLLTGLLFIYSVTIFVGMILSRSGEGINLIDLKDYYDWATDLLVVKSRYFYLIFSVILSILTSPQFAKDGYVVFTMFGLKEFGDLFQLEMVLEDGSRVYRVIDDGMFIKDVNGTLKFIDKSHKTVFMLSTPSIQP